MRRGNRLEATGQPQGPDERAVAVPPAPATCDHLWALYKPTVDIVVVEDANGVPVMGLPGQHDLYYCQRDPRHIFPVSMYEAVRQ